MAISRDEVVHVARLARLALTEEELDRFAGQLDAILEAVGKVAELDLVGRRADLAPARRSSNVWAEDEPRPSCRSRRRSPTRPTARTAPSACPPGEPSRARTMFHSRHTVRHRHVRRASGYGVWRGPGDPLGAVRGGARVIDTLRLTAEEATGLARARARSSAPSSTAPTCDAIAERDPELHAYLCTVEEPEGEGVPIALKDVISTRRASRRPPASKILEGYKPVFDATVAARCKAAGLPLLGKTNMDEFAMGSSTENSAYGPTRNPWDPSRVPGGSSGGSTAAVAAGPRPVGARLRHRRLDQAARRALRRRRPAADLRHRLALRDRRLRLQPRPGRPDREDRRATARSSTGSSPAATRSTRPPSSCRSRSSSRRPRT